MRQLGAHDASFLYSDTAHSNANVTLIHVYDQPTAPGGKLRFKSILAHVESRLERLPVFRQKLCRVPLDLDFPYWVDDEHFDLEYHVRHLALPKPGDWRQFCIQVSRIHARPLDLNRPLWEIYVIEGLDSFLDLPRGSFALLAKTHHAAVDVESGSEITMLLHDLHAEPAKAAPPAPWFPEAPPGVLAMAARGTVNSLFSAARLAGPLGRAVRRIAPVALRAAGEWLRQPAHIPVTRFNSVVSPHRVFETRRFALDEFKAARALVAGATVNDVVLAVCGGALRRYLGGHGELPQASLTAMTPMYLRAPGAAASTRPELAWVRVQLGTDLANPAQRLARVCEQTGSPELASRAVGARELTDLERHAPAATLALAGKLLGRALGGIGRRAPLASCTVTNVPGPSVPLYLCGARMTYFSAMMPVADGMGLVFAVTSYDGQVVISPTSCRELMPDPEFFAQCVRESFQEIGRAAQALRGGRRARPTAACPAQSAAAAPTAARRRASRAGTRSPTSPVA